MAPISPLLSLSLLILLTFCPLPASFATKPVFFASVASPNPFTAKASVLRYWNRKIPRSVALPRPDFFVSKLSPLSALDSATYSAIAASNPVGLSAHLPAFCAAARLLCSPDVTPSLASHRTDANFAAYDNTNFTNYGAGRPGGLDSFKNYSQDNNLPINTFRSYSHGGVGHDASFTAYSNDGNVVTDNFTSYGSGATGGDSGFTGYQRDSNAPNLKFNNYAANSNGHTPTFTSYSDDTNAGDQSFAGYGKHSNGVPTTFTSYGNNSNVIGSTFTGYGESGNGAVDSFTQYGSNGNVPENNFRSYGDDGNAGTDTFTSYRDQSNVGDDSFKSYGKGGTGSTVGFTGYGNSFNPGSTDFKGYGLGGNDPNVSFKSYSGDNTTFKEYAKSGVNFKSYKNTSVVPAADAGSIGSSEHLVPAADAGSIGSSEHLVPAADAGSIGSSEHLAAAEVGTMSRWVVEPGKFFRESSMKKGTVMPMPDIRDKMPARSFLPRSISSRIASSADEVRRVFNLPADTALGKAVEDTIVECARAPSKGETKRCAMSAEDVIDFAESVLGDGAVVRSTESARGSGGNVAIGEVRGIDGGRITRSVSCHQSLFPYLVYYCHSVPKVRLYEAEILSVDSKEKINHGVAICHIDTADWSAGHGAFAALGAGPGKIEVCHWIFDGDMTWTAQDWSI